MASIQTFLERIANNYSPENLHVTNAADDHANFCVLVAGSPARMVALWSQCLTALFRFLLFARPEFIVEVEFRRLFPNRV
jgi:hypothetical protein